MILTVAMGKGGSAKTTTAWALAAAARKDGKRVLCIDLDPAANLTAAMGGNPAAPGLFSILTDKSPAAAVIQQTGQGDLIAAGLNLEAAAQLIQNKPGRDFILKTALQPIRGNYDLLILDTQPGLSTLLVNALAASDAVLLTTQARSFAIMGLYQIAETIAQVQKYCNPALSVLGILYAQHTPNRALARDLTEAVEAQAQRMGTRLLDTYIRPSEALPQAQAMQQDIFTYAPRSNGAKDYQKLYDEIRKDL